MFTRSLRTVLVVAALSALAKPALAGPPWISAEFPANPHEAATRGAFLLVHTYHHGNPTEFPLTGTAEGLVNGRRQTLRLEIVATSKPGVYAVRFKPQGAGAWVLAFNLGETRDGAGMIVSVGKDGQPGAARVPSSTAEGGRWIIPRSLTPQDIDAALRTQVALNDVPVDRNGGGVPVGAVVALGLVLGFPLVRRMRTAS
jgi:hypothetical protein